MISLVLTAISCGKKEKDVPTAAESMEKHKEIRIITDAVNAPFEFEAKKYAEFPGKTFISGNTIFIVA